LLVGFILRFTFTFSSFETWIYCILSTVTASTVTDLFILCFQVSMCYRHVCGIVMFVQSYLQTQRQRVSNTLRTISLSCTAWCFGVGRNLIKCSVGHVFYLIYLIMKVNWSKWDILGAE
jgi:hypothetical protein